jgi:hypothetical protein
VRRSVTVSKLNDTVNDVKDKAEELFEDAKDDLEALGDKVGKKADFTQSWIKRHEDEIIRGIKLGVILSFAAALVLVFVFLF